VCKKSHDLSFCHQLVVDDGRVEGVRSPGDRARRDDPDQSLTNVDRQAAGQQEYLASWRGTLNSQTAEDLDKIVALRRHHQLVAVQVSGSGPRQV
jgi:hypothetical protein